MKVANLGKTLYRGTKNLWVKYHFLVPPRLWKKYAKLLWSIVMEGRGVPYLNPFDVKAYNTWLAEFEEETE